MKLQKLKMINKFERGQALDIYVTLNNAVPVYFAQPDALKGSLVETLKEVRPTR